MGRKPQAGKVRAEGGKTPPTYTPEQAREALRQWKDYQQKLAEAQSGRPRAVPRPGLFIYDGWLECAGVIVEVYPNGTACCEGLTGARWIQSIDMLDLPLAGGIIDLHLGAMCECGHWGSHHAWDRGRIACVTCKREGRSCVKGGAAPVEETIEPHRRRHLQVADVTVVSLTPEGEKAVDEGGAA
jgi:hypothetical protein